MNPDCEGSKHTACSGTAWDETTDQLVPCACTCHHTTPTGRVQPEPTNERPVTGL